MASRAGGAGYPVTTRETCPELSLTVQWDPEGRPRLTTLIGLRAECRRPQLDVWPLMVIGLFNFVVVDRDHTAERPLIEIGLRVARWACATAADGDRAAVWPGRSAIGMCGGC